MKDDAISRQAAIEAVSKGCQEWRGIFGRCEENILALPSAQPETAERTTEMAQNVSDGDLISRKAAMNRIDEALARVFKEPCGELILRKVPSAQPEQRWIPCSERLPEEDTEVLISYRYKEGEGDTDHVNIDITSYGTTCFGGREIHTLKEWRQPFDYFHANYEVIAWMPLPTPYREE